MNNMNKCDAQIILYCKNWFEKTELMDDIKVIMGQAFAIEPELFTPYEVYKYISKLYFKYRPNKLYENDFLELFKYQNTHDIFTMTRWLCGRIQGWPVRDHDGIILDVGEPDYTILPRRLDR